MGLAAKHEADRLLGRTLRRRWTLERVIGRGGTGTVYAATHRNGAQVAIKVLHPALRRDLTVRRRFLREGTLANRIGGPGVVKVIDDESEDDLVYLVMELLEGESMEDLRRRAGGRLGACDVVEVGVRLLGVLERTHARGVLHGDLKPANLFRTIEPIGLKVLDFGVARILGGQPPSDDAAPIDDQCLGTPGFMAPEQARCQDELLDERTDLWAVGATLFTLFTGEHVHPGRSVTELLQSARQAPARRVRERLSAAPPHLAAIIERALSFDRDTRYGSAAEMRIACERSAMSLAARGDQSTLFNVDAKLAVRRTRARGDPRPRVLAEDAASHERTVPSHSGNPRAGFWMGRVGRLWWFHYTGPCTEETWPAYLAMFQRMLDTARPSTLLCLAHQADAPTAPQRKTMAAFFRKNRHALTRLDRFALVFDSISNRHALTAIGRVVRKPFEERVFISPLAAIRWLAENHAELDPDAVRTSILAEVPRNSVWPVLRGDEAITVPGSS